MMMSTTTTQSSLVDQLDLHTSYKNDGIYDSLMYDTETNNKWKDMLVPVEMRVPGGEDQDQGLHLDLNTLLKVLDQHSTEGETGSGGHSTWQLVIIQAILLSLLVIVSVTWACCCKRNCFKSDTGPRVQEALRKLSSASLKSRDYPPSYSQADLHTLAMSVHDYLYPPPDYPEVFNRTADDLAYLDLEAGHRRLSRLSFSGTHSPIPSIHGSPVSPKNSISMSGSPVSPKNSISLSGSPLSPRNSIILPGLAGGHHSPVSRQSTWSSISSSDSRRSSVHRDSDRHTRKSSLKDPASRRGSLTPDSRRGSQSRISFNESVECSNGSYRRLSGTQEHSPVSRQSSSTSLPVISRQSSNSSLPIAHLSRQGSSSSLPVAHLSRQNSSPGGLVGEETKQSNLMASRKLGLSQESLNEELMRKLEAIERIEEETVEVEVEAERPRNSLETVIEVENH